MAELDLDDGDVTRVPALFERLSSCPYGTEPVEVVALIPALVNLGVITLPDQPPHLVVPDPSLRPGNAPLESDPLVRAFTALAPAGVEVTFVDDWYTYHVGHGEVHCGMSVARAPVSDGFDAAWRDWSMANRGTGWPPGAPATVPRAATPRDTLRELPRVAGVAPPIRTQAGSLRLVDPTLSGNGGAQRRLLAALPTAASSELRAAIVEVLPRTGDGWAPAVLRHFSREPDVAVRKVAIAALRWADEANRVRGAHLGLRDEAAAVRMEAAIVASHLTRHVLQQTGLAPKLVSLLTDDDPQVRAMAVRTSGLRALTQARPALGSLLHDPAPRVRREARRAIDRLQ
jgi:hypothetical protein